MKILHFMPAYRGQLQIEAAYSMMRDLLWSVRNEHELVPVYRSSTWIHRTRNWVLGAAIDNGYDLLLMQDADVYGHGVSPLERLLKTMRTWSADVVGAAVRHRDGERMNCEPARPGEIYEGEVGTGLMLIDVKRAAEVEGPWFDVELDESGSRVVCGEDIWFCRHMRSAGMRVYVDATIPTGHVGEVPLIYG